MADAGPEPEVAIEATYGWYWAVDVLEELGAQVRLVNPSGLQWGDRRVKNDYRDCKELLDRMRLDKLPEAWIAPPPVRELRELVRYRAQAGVPAHRAQGPGEGGAGQARPAPAGQ